MASWLYRLLAQKVGGTYATAEAKTLYHQLLEVSAMVTVEDSRCFASVGTGICLVVEVAGPG
jgi:hypothetical protein